MSNFFLIIFNYFLSAVLNAADDSNSRVKTLFLEELYQVFQLKTGGIIRFFMLKLCFIAALAHIYMYVHLPPVLHTGPALMRTLRKTCSET